MRRIPCVSDSRTLKFLINPSARRIFATSTFNLDVGMSTLSWTAWLAFLILVSMSAIVSVIMAGWLHALRFAFGTRGSRTFGMSTLEAAALLPTRLDHTRDLSPEGQVPEADTTHH